MDVNEELKFNGGSGGGVGGREGSGWGGHRVDLNKKLNFL